MSSMLSTQTAATQPSHREEQPLLSPGGGGGDGSKIDQRRRCCPQSELLPLIIPALLVTIGLAAAIYGIIAWTHQLPPEPPPKSWCPIYCDSDLLREVQRAGIFESNKIFVDLPMKADPDVITANFEKLKRLYNADVTDPMANGERSSLPVEALRQFVDDNFFAAENVSSNEVMPWVPEDFHAHPDFVKSISNEAYRNWALEVHHIWKSLGKQLRPDVFKHPQRHSLIPSKHPFIVPGVCNDCEGGRFREIYYWDTYWVIRGLLVSGMRQTAKGMVENLLGMVEEFGFVPNGSRRYYLNRSQPPLLAIMVELIYDDILLNGPIPKRHDDKSTNNLAFDPSSTWTRFATRLRVGVHSATKDANQQAARTWLARALPALDHEYKWWMRQGHHAVTITIGDHDYIVNRYYVNATRPRPESFRKDETTTMNQTTNEKLTRYSDLAAGAESGWDYSSRWFADSFNISTIVTRQVLPVDLNSYFCRSEGALARMHKSVGNDHKAEKYSAAKEARRKVLHDLFWNHELSQWGDIRMDLPPHNGAMLSNFIPLWSDCVHDGADYSAITRALETSGLMLDGGLATTTIDNDEQWDFPNAWAPLQHMIIEGLEAAATTQTQALALKLASTWVATNYGAYMTPTPQHDRHLMYEKYDVRVLGTPGHGGEYKVQHGFGWANGVILALLQRYGSSLHPPLAAAPAS